MKNSEHFFSNIDCQYFPCHATNKPEDFNCKFCYCPLYLLNCNGNYKMVGDIKDCSNCTIPHQVNADKYINKILSEQVFYKK